MFDAVKAIDTSLQNEADQLSPPEARYWAAEKKSKTGNDSDDDIFGSMKTPTSTGIGQLA